MLERKVQGNWGSSIKYEDFKKLVDTFEAERFGTDEAITEFVNISYRPGGETSASSSSITFISRKRSE